MVPTGWIIVGGGGGDKERRLGTSGHARKVRGPVPPDVSKPL